MDETEKLRSELRTHTQWNAIRFGVPFGCGLIGMSGLYSLLATVERGWAFGVGCFIAAMAFFILGWRRELRGVEQAKPETGRGAMFVFIAAVLTLVGIFGPLALVP